MESESRIYVAGHNGMVGSAVARRLRAEGYANLLSRERAELDLTNQSAVEAFFAEEAPEYVFLCAAKVGGIHANSTFPADFIHDNLAIQTNVIHAAWKHGAKRLLFLGSSCIYPRDCPQPMSVKHLLTGPLEPTNEAYAIAKIAGIKMCEAYRRQHGFSSVSVMPTNLYGPGDNFHSTDSHVLPGLVRRFSEAVRERNPFVRIWGDGSPMREFLHVDDLASALLLIMSAPPDIEIINVGSGEEVSIRELATMIADATGFKGELVFDSSMPNGAPRKLLDSEEIHSLGWWPTVPLTEGIARVVSELALSYRQ